MSLFQAPKASNLIPAVPWRVKRLGWPERTHSDAANPALRGLYAIAVQSAIPTSRLSARKHQIFLQLCLWPEVLLSDETWRLESA